MGRPHLKDGNGFRDIAEKVGISGQQAHNITKAALNKIVKGLRQKTNLSYTEIVSFLCSEYKIEAEEIIFLLNGDIKEHLKKENN